MSRKNAFLDAAKKYEKPMVRFLREMVAIPSESTEEGPVIARIRKEMEATSAFDKIWVDGLGNLLGMVGKPGKGKKLIAIDAHVDTVGVGERSEWKHDPYKGKVADGKVWGRGAGDQEGAIPAMVYAAKILRDLKVDLSQFALLTTFTVMEEDCDGLCWQYIVQEDKIRPDVVVVTDSTDCKILRGQRGRMEIGVTCLGRSCHGSMPEKGDNAVYKSPRSSARLRRSTSGCHRTLFSARRRSRSATSTARRRACARCRAKRTFTSTAG
jgi:putative selenium metabolism hydrolase